MWIDCHAHIVNLTDAQQEEVLTRAGQAGVRWMVNAGDDEKSCERILALVDRWPQVYGNLGIHPHNAKDATDSTFQTVERNLGHAKILAVGEVGLDFYYDHSPRDIQIGVLERFLDLATSRAKPVVIHHRDSSEETVHTLKKFQDKGLRGMIHCFSGSWDFAKEALELGFYLSFSGILTFRKANDLRDIAAKVPADRLLIETDSPYLSPEPVRGKTNEPANVVYTARRLAELRGLSPENLAVQLRENFQRLFGVSL